MEQLDDYRITVLLCLTIGLVPFFPEPHIWGKLKWIAGGANSMGIQDWFDVLLHGFSWILLMRLILIKITRKHGA
ncbi:MAG: hypothetical protein ACJAZK_001596 [Psychroserpens sp.]|jgi:hypothetical protein|uniref:hypothetical protein n=1 Tax=Psychroserpens sp. TaxID=2020870 RepID=UPI0039E25AE9